MGLYLMYASSKINDSPGHFMVLQAIARCLDTVDKIATATRKSEDEVKDIINDLVNQRLANMRVKGRFFGSKETRFTITETGSSLLGVKQQEHRQSQEDCNKCMTAETDSSYRPTWIRIECGSLITTENRDILDVNNYYTAGTTRISRLRA